jgi:hypothetical protein
MGSSPSADLYYGYDLGMMYDSDYESTAPDWWQEAEDNSDDREEKMAACLGFEGGSWSERWAFLRAYPVGLVTYGSDEGDEFWALQVKASVQTADDYGSIKLNPLAVDPGWDDLIARFVELLELSMPADGLGWHLNCSYG